MAGIHLHDCLQTKQEMVKRRHWEVHNWNVSCKKWEKVHTISIWNADELAQSARLAFPFTSSPFSLCGCRLMFCECKGPPETMWTSTRRAWFCGRCLFFGIHQQNPIIFAKHTNIRIYNSLIVNTKHLQLPWTTTNSKKNDMFVFAWLRLGI